MSGSDSMKGLRWILAVRRDPAKTRDWPVAILRARLVPLERRIGCAVTEGVRTAARALTCGVVTAALALVGTVYVLIGAWLGFSGYADQVDALFVVDALFLIMSPVPLRVLHASARK